MRREPHGDRGLILIISLYLFDFYNFELVHSTELIDIFKIQFRLFQNPMTIRPSVGLMDWVMDHDHTHYKKPVFPGGRACGREEGEGVKEVYGPKNSARRSFDLPYTVI